MGFWIAHGSVENKKIKSKIIFKNSSKKIRERIKNILNCFGIMDINENVNSIYIDYLSEIQKLGKYLDLRIYDNLKNLMNVMNKNILSYKENVGYKLGINLLEEKKKLGINNSYFEGNILTKNIVTEEECNKIKEIFSMHSPTYSDSEILKIIDSDIIRS